MGKKENKIAVSEWLAELRRVNSYNDDGMSLQEWADAMEVSYATMNRNLKKAKRLGLLRQGFRTATALDGKAYRCPVYQIIEDPAS